MKLMVPVAGIFVAAGACCCCGGGDIESMIEEMENQSGGAAMDDIKIEEPSEAGGSSGSGGGGSFTAGEGTCGRFKTDGMPVPDGLSVLSCATMGDTESIVMQGSGSPAEVCKPMKAWATSTGWSVTTEAAMGDTTSIILKDNNSKQLVVACSNMTGQTTVSVSISKAY